MEFTILNHAGFEWEFGIFRLHNTENKHTLLTSLSMSFVNEKLFYIFISSIIVFKTKTRYTTVFIRGHTNFYEI